MQTPVLVASIPCEDVLRSEAVDGRFTLHRMLFDIYAPAYPARLARLVVANVWRGGRGEFTDHTRILAPDRAALAESTAGFTASEQGQHVQVHVFLDLVLPEPGDYTVEVHRTNTLVLSYTLTAALLEEGKGR